MVRILLFAVLNSSGYEVADCNRSVRGLAVRLRIGNDDSAATATARNRVHAF